MSRLQARLLGGILTAEQLHYPAQTQADPLHLSGLSLAALSQLQQDVITSYSIHYTKLYEPAALTEQLPERVETSPSLPIDDILVFATAALLVVRAQGIEIILPVLARVAVVIIVTPGILAEHLLGQVGPVPVICTCRLGDQGIQSIRGLGIGTHLQTIEIQSYNFV